MKLVTPLELYKMVKRPGGRLLGMDVGSTYVGLAISTEKYNFASPYGYEIQNYLRYIGVWNTKLIATIPYKDLLYVFYWIIFFIEISFIF